MKRAAKSQEKDPTEQAVSAKIERRSAELALNHGRPAKAKTPADVTWAKRELKPLKLRPQKQEQTEQAVSQKIERRSSELALNHGRPAKAKTAADVEWAKRELKPLKITSPKKRST